jgi:hypothetical protein
VVIPVQTRFAASLNEVVVPLSEHLLNNPKGGTTDTNPVAVVVVVVDGVAGGVFVVVGASAVDGIEDSRSKLLKEAPCVMRREGEDTKRISGTTVPNKCDEGECHSARPKWLPRG